MGPAGRREAQMIDALLISTSIIAIIWFLITVLR
jgi:hypothetical protein